jgi:hypothetical protein
MIPHSMRKSAPFFEKFYKSTILWTIFSFVLVVVIAAIIFAPTRMHASAATIFWFSVITKGLPAALFFLMLARLRAKNFSLALGIKQAQLPLLKKAVQTGVLPKDKKLRNALPGYMYAQYSWTKPRAKQIVIFLAVIFGINLLADIGARSTLKVVVDCAAIIALVMAYRSMRKRIPTIARFYEELGVDPETAKPVRPKLRIRMPVASDEALTLVAKMILTLVGAVFGTMIVSVAISAGIVSPWVILPIVVPLGLVGLLYLSPFFLLKGRWALGYCIVLALATIVAIHQLHMPLGHNHHVGAQTPLPPTAHSVTAYTIWAVLHSTIALIITSSAILLAMAFAKKQARETEKELWMIFATIGAALTLFSFGISWPAR